MANYKFAINTITKRLLHQLLTWDDANVKRCLKTSKITVFRQLSNSPWTGRATRSGFTWPVSQVTTARSPLRGKVVKRWRLHRMAWLHCPALSDFGKPALRPDRSAVAMRSRDGRSRAISSGFGSPEPGVLKTLVLNREAKLDGRMVNK